MQSIRTVVVEDEQAGLENLLLKIARNSPFIEVIGTYTSGEAAIEGIPKDLPDLIFLDINLGTMTGFDVLERLKDVPFEIIITTSYDQYALQAIKANALDYLLKPIDELELVQAVNKAFKVIQAKSKTASRIAVPIKNGLKFLNTDDIVYCKADNNCTFIHLTDGKKILVTRTLNDIVQKLPEPKFFRVHRSSLINLNFVDSFSNEDGGYLIMKDKEELSVSREKKEELMRRLAK
ncbi:MAG TPA: LytTR family DNA-binding domain-containing protein [Haliscomenobacter sp.]|uniref:LytR/AlgR family response regulator transcription factor n=1 Tax=Haliscomenobacter sp. TaxID=2717303 RepID=UPI002C7A50FE|nr:LytTR family DNA-binding domain-containing protein [Haliscomenobacter sp.]HOY16408.1 LytTR family DNA-binding domain-containing protein [Haliscomenobacter sp.]HPH21116.1 LytTR family DNA-binding domain-containing protein [Haliscomenobacter sp.]